MSSGSSSRRRPSRRRCSRRCRDPVTSADADVKRFRVWSDQRVIDPRNRPALIAAILLGVGAFVVLWLWVGWSPLLAWLVGWSVPAFALYGIDKRQARGGGW